MAGNSKRRGAVRKAGTKKGPTVGSGGVRRRGLEGKGATPAAKDRPNHPAAKRAAKAARQQRGRPQRKTDDVELVLGRNPVVECLRAGVPATALYVALGADPLDERWESKDETSAALAAVDVLVQAEVARRADARDRRDWAEADAIRDRLKEAGIEVTDTGDGPQWTLLDGYTK